MFEALPASIKTAPPRARVITSALLLHAVLIAAAVSSTASSGVTAPEAARDTIRVDLAIVEHRQATIPPVAPAPLMPAAPRLQTVPPAGPDLELPQLRFDGPVTAAAADPLPSLSVSRSTGATDSSLSLSRPSEVEQLPQLLTDLHPEYPRVLQRAGVGGAVEVEYVVGKDGRVDAGSLQVLRTDHEQFSASVSRALRGARFRAARRAGRPVAVLVRQVIRFRSDTP